MKEWGRAWGAGPTLAPLPDWHHASVSPPVRYIIGTLELMVAENYTLVCLSGATARSQVPALSWLRQCYQTIDQR